MNKRIVVVSDMHVGSKYAVSPPVVTISESPSFSETTTQKATSIRLQLFEKWKEVTQKYQAPDVLVINGEPIEGTNYKHPSEVWSVNLFDQINAAKQLVQMFNAKKIYVTRGSDYHALVNDQHFEDYFAQLIGAEKIGSKYTQEVLNLSINGRLFNFAHHLPSTLVFQYRSTALARELAMLKLNASHFFPKGLDADVVVRSHVHYFWVIQTTSHIGMITPCWKLEDWYMRRKGAGATSDIGAVQFTVSADGVIDWDASIFKIDSAKPPIVRV
jgi:hypothetical protein